MGPSRFTLELFFPSTIICFFFFPFLFVYRSIWTVVCFSLIRFYRGIEGRVEYNGEKEQTARFVRFVKKIDRWVKFRLHRRNGRGFNNNCDYGNRIPRLDLDLLSIYTRFILWYRFQV